MVRSGALLCLGACLVAACGDAGGGSSSEATAQTGESTGGGSTGGSEPTTGGDATTSEAPTSGGPTSGTSGEDSTGAGSTGSDTADPSTTGGFMDIEEALDWIDGLEWEEQACDVPDYRCFLLLYQQPVDHDDPDGQQFTQHIQLLHRDAGAPVVINTEGYNIYEWYWYLSEPAYLLQANQLFVEHRFFAGSRPDPADWGLLRIEQAAADHHRITHALQLAIYDTPWVSTGASKGGMTASYFKRFYPDDLAGTVAYVAPLSYGTTDPRYWPYLTAIGDPACTQALTAFRREVLIRRDAMLARMDAEAMQDGYTYDIVGPEQALEVVALEASWGFWQYGGAGKCPDVPTPMASDDEVWDFLNLVNAPHDISDARVLAFEPYFFQASVQLGAPATVEDELADLLMFPGFDVPQSFVVPGPTKEMVFDPAAMEDIADWAANEATNVVWVYGERDPWSGGAYEVEQNPNVHKFVAPGQNHGAKIEDLTPEDRAVVFAQLEAWTGVQPIAGTPPIPPPLPLRLGILP